MIIEAVAQCAFDLLVPLPAGDDISTSDDTDASSGDEKSPSSPKKMKKNESQPDVDDVVSYLQLLHYKSGVAEEVLIVTLIFLKRLMLSAGTKLTARNWRSLLATALLLASKTFDDLAMSNRSFSCFLPFNLQEINKWERLFLAGIKYDCNVSNEEFAAQYMDLLSLNQRGNMKISPSMRVVQMRRYSSESFRV